MFEVHFFLFKTKLQICFEYFGIIAFPEDGQKNGTYRRLLQYKKACIANVVVPLYE